MAKKQKKRLESCLITIFLLSLVGLLAGVVWLYQTITTDVKSNFGESDPSLGIYKYLLYSTRLYFSENKLLVDQNDLNEDYFFEILPGETVGKISYRLKMNNLIVDF